MDLFDAHHRRAPPAAPTPGDTQTPRRGMMASHAWASTSKVTTPYSTRGKGGTGSGSGGAGSVGGAERYGYLSFSEVQVRGAPGSVLSSWVDVAEA